MQATAPQGQYTAHSFAAALLPASTPLPPRCPATSLFGHAAALLLRHAAAALLRCCAAALLRCCAEVRPLAPPALLPRTASPITHTHFPSADAGGIAHNDGLRIRTRMH